MQPFFGGNSMFEDPFGGNSMMQMNTSSNAFGGSSSFSCQTMSFSSRLGADGRMHTEQFSSSTVADGRRGARETKQAYANSATGTNKLSMERNIGDRGKKEVREHCEENGESRQTTMMRGMSEEEGERFNQEWEDDVAPHLPSHRVQLQLGHGPGSSTGKGRSKGSAPSGRDLLALEAPEDENASWDSSGSSSRWQHGQGANAQNRTPGRQSWRSAPY